MTAVFPAVAALVAAAMGLLAAVLVVQVIRNRVRLGVHAGDGGHAPLAQAIRAHANLVEQAPLVLVLLALAEAAGAWRSVVVGLGVVFVVARLASAWGLSHSLGPSSARQSGAGLTVLVTVAAAILVGWRAVQML